MAQTLTDWKDLIPELDALPARPKRIILHWTGGTYEPNSLELEHYHFLVDGEGVVHPGTHSVADNMRKLQKGDDYAAHTRGYNSFSVGIAFCGMRGATPGRNFGAYPLKKEQVLRGLEFVGLATYVWGLNPRDPRHLFTHFEAEALHGVDQLPVGEGTWKWDITELEFAPHLDKWQVGDWLRQETMVRRKLVLNFLSWKPSVEPQPTLTYPLLPPQTLDFVQFSEYIDYFASEDPDDLDRDVP